MNIRRLLVTTFFSLSLCQYFIVPQRPIFDLLKWEEINNNQILIHKVGPIINTDNKFSEITSFYYSDSTSKRIVQGELFPEIIVNNTDETSLRLYGTVGINLSERLIIQNEFEFDNKGENDLHFQGIKRETAKGWVGYLQHSSLTYYYPSGHLSLGRGNPYFFNMNESLLINPNFPPAEYLWWRHEIRWFQFDWGFLMLNEKESLNRFLFFHRYGINNNTWRVGFTESVMGTYENWGSEEMGYIMPAAVLLETEENRGINTNLMWLVDGMYKWKNLTFYGEFLIDDFALDGQSPPQIAGSIGLGRKFGQALFNVEYTRINRWTGNYCNVDNDTSHIHTWIERNVPIGHSIGSDAHQILINNYVYLNKKVAVDFYFKWLGSGEGDAIDRLKKWPENVACDTNFGNNEPPPSEKYSTYYTGGTLSYLFKENILAKLNIKFNSDSKTSLGLNISYHYK